MAVTKVSACLIVEFLPQFDPTQSSKPALGGYQQHSALARPEINECILAAALQKAVLAELGGRISDVSAGSGS
jgi:hypothetical protein